MKVLLAPSRTRQDRALYVSPKEAGALCREAGNTWHELLKDGCETCLFWDFDFTHRHRVQRQTCRLHLGEVRMEHLKKSWRRVSTFTVRTGRFILRFSHVSNDRADSSHIAACGTSPNRPRRAIKRSDRDHALPLPEAALTSQQPTSIVPEASHGGGRGC